MKRTTIRCLPELMESGTCSSLDELAGDQVKLTATKEGECWTKRKLFYLAVVFATVLSASTCTSTILVQVERKDLNVKSLRWTTRKATADVSVLQDSWVHIVGDSSLRMFNAALIHRLNNSGDLDSRFGSFVIHDKGGCEGEQDPKDACFREYINFPQGIRITYVFKTFASQPDLFLPKLVTDTQRPKHFLFATGAWDLGYSSSSVNETVIQTLNWLNETILAFPDSTVTFANLVACYPPFKEKAVAFNRDIWEKIQQSHVEEVRILDRERGTVNVTDRTLCDGWHAFKEIVLGHVDDFRRILRGGVVNGN